tara:strand:+ start:633 stop:1382 length:750 start_codon:yes stop_codon:yes gene_type:complete
MSNCPNPFLNITDHTPYYPKDNVQFVAPEHPGIPYLTTSDTPQFFNEDEIIRFKCNNIRSRGGRSLAPYIDTSVRDDSTYHPKITCNNSSWDYTHGWGVPGDISEDQRVGPECQRPKCPQTYHELNRSLSLYGFELNYPESVFNEISKHPESGNMQYHKDPEKNVILGINKLQADSIIVKCKDKPDIISSIKCRYMTPAAGPPNLNYDQSIEQLDPSICTRTRTITFNPLVRTRTRTTCASGNLNTGTV